MPNIPRVGDLEIPQDLDYQRREWIFERAGWTCMALVVLAAVLGLLGRGPLSGTSAADPGGALRVEYHRFLHNHDPATLRVHLSGAATRNDEVRVWLSQEYLREVQVKTVTPEPERVEAGSDRQVFVFRVADRDRPAEITFRFEAEAVGPLSGQVGVGDGEPVRFRQFVYP